MACRQIIVMAMVAVAGANSLSAQERADSGKVHTLDSLVVAAAPKPVAGPAVTASGETPAAAASEAPPKEVSVSSYTVQFASPDAGAVDAALGAVRGAAGVRGAATSSIAIGGTSVMRVSFAGDLDALAAALRARGWQVTVGSNALSIRR